MLDLKSEAKNILDSSPTVHWICWCDETISLCGLEIDNIVQGKAIECVVCLDLSKVPTPCCGAVLNEE